MLYGFVVSFFSWNILEPPKFVAFGNYEKMLLTDPLTAKVVGNSLYYVFGALPAAVLLPMFIAMLLDRKSVV